MDGVYLDGYVEADLIRPFTAPTCPDGSTSAGDYTTHQQVDTLDSVANIGAPGGSCGFGKPVGLQRYKSAADTAYIHRHIY